MGCTCGGIALAYWCLHLGAQSLPANASASHLQALPATMLGQTTLMQTLHGALPSEAREFCLAWCMHGYCPLFCLFSVQLMPHLPASQVWIWASGGADMVRLCPTACHVHAASVLDAFW
jgi:hypothetical protein